MNYFAHALPFLDDPYLAAGSGVPDWLSVIDRRVRVRRKNALPLVEDADPRVAAVARGIIQHIDDDGQFHKSRAFTELCLELTGVIRAAVPDDGSFRATFLSHLLVEVLLDAALIEEFPEHLDRYHKALKSVDPTVIQQTVNRISTRETDRLAHLSSVSWTHASCRITPKMGNYRCE